ncbi:MAG: NUDIX domain-containing protein [Bacteroidota bacterium]
MAEMEWETPHLLAEIQDGQLLPHHSIDCVVLGYDKRELKVLLVRWRGEEMWGLPGGFVRKTENFEEAASRILTARTGLRDVYLEQFHTFTNVDRNQSASSAEAAMFQRVSKRLPGGTEVARWLQQRFVSTGYFALIQLDEATPRPDFLSDACSWHPVSHLPRLILDHGQMLARARLHLRQKVNYLPVGLKLLPEKFTMGMLQSLYEAILQRPLVRSNFQRKMLSLGTLQRHEKLKTGAANKAPYLYSFMPEAYYRLVREGIGF